MKTAKRIALEGLVILASKGHPITAWVGSTMAGKIVDLVQRPQVDLDTALSKIELELDMDDYKLQKAFAEIQLQQELEALKASLNQNK
jgi:hypothetical protein